MENEIWKHIKGYEGLYEISSEGRVRSLGNDKSRKTKVLKPGKNKNGYLYVVLYKNGEQKHLYIHRLVAEAFIPNPLNKTDVNHLTEDKTQNSVDRLEWATRSENCNFGTRNERVSKAQSKPVIQLTKDGELIAEYPSIAEASRQTGINQGNISGCCRGRIKSAGGYVWRYKEILV